MSTECAKLAVSQRAFDKLVEDVLNGVSEVWRTLSKRVLPQVGDDLVVRLTPARVLDVVELDSTPALLAVYGAPDYDYDPEEAGVDYAVFKYTAEKVKARYVELEERGEDHETFSGLEVVVGDEMEITVPPGSYSEAFTLAGSPELSQKLEELARKWGAKDAVEWFEVLKGVVGNLEKYANKHLPSVEGWATELVVAVVAGRVLRSVGVGIGVVPDLDTGYARSRFYVIDTNRGQVLANKRMASLILKSISRDELERYLDACRRARVALLAGTIAMQLYWNIS